MKHCVIVILFFTHLFVFAQKQELQNNFIEIKNNSLNKSISIELTNGNLLRGELLDVDNSKEIVLLQNASDITEVSFKNIYKIHEFDKERGVDYMYRTEVPERFFYTPMGNTIPKGMVSLENFFFINSALKVGVTDRLELGVGFTLWNDGNEDDEVTVFPMGTIKYKFVDRRHFKASIGATSLQLPPVFIQSGGLSSRKPWFNVLYASANWEYKYGTFAFAVAQPYINTYALRNNPSVSFNDSGIDYMFSSSFSVKIFPFAHFISENIFLSGAWNTLGQPNRINRNTYLIPLVGGRYYGDYYSFSAGVSNMFIPNAVFWFYLGGSYYFN